MFDETASQRSTGSFDGQPPGTPRGYVGNYSSSTPSNFGSTDVGAARPDEDRLRQPSRDAEPRAEHADDHRVAAPDQHHAASAAHAHRLEAIALRLARGHHLALGGRDALLAGDQIPCRLANLQDDVLLDPALLRPGRFDRQVVVGLPDIRGREQILKVHMRKVPISDNVKAGVIARGTPGFSGADLANLVNEAALTAARRGHETVEHGDITDALEKIVLGAERQVVIKAEDRERTAYHESGHAVVMHNMENSDPVHKVSIISRGMALGYTMPLPESEKYLRSKEAFEDEIVGLLGGRAAEEIILNHITTGAANDLERATELARRMVTEFGMAEALGPVRYAPQAGAGYLGRMAGVRPELSPETAAAVDHETRRLVEAAQDKALGLLREQEGVAAQVLMNLGLKINR